MRYGSVCSGIEAATVAWHSLGWQPSFFAEIDKFPSAVLAHHYPDVPNAGDFTKIKEGDHARIDVLVGGTPCQSFSVAGKRLGLDDPRGNLALEFIALARRLRPRWLVFENVPGLLSSDGGRDFGTFLGALEQCGYHAAWRVLDAQHIRVDTHPRAVPQRRKRLFVVGYLGDWRPAAAVLFELESLQGHPAPRREAGEGIATTISARTNGGGGVGTDFDLDGGLISAPVANTLNASFGHKQGLENEHINAGTIEARQVPQAVAFNARQDPIHGPVTGPLDTVGATQAVAQGLAVRRLTPTECERLMGVPDGYTAVPYRGKPAADGPRYKALGNSFAVNVMRWIGQRIKAFEDAR